MLSSAHLDTNEDVGFIHVSANARLCQTYTCLDEYREHYEEIPFKIG